MFENFDFHYRRTIYLSLLNSVRTNTGIGFHQGTIMDMSQVVTGFLLSECLTKADARVGEGSYYAQIKSKGWSRRTYKVLYFKDVLYYF